MNFQCLKSLYIKRLCSAGTRAVKYVHNIKPFYQIVAYTTGTASLINFSSFLSLSWEKVLEV